MRAKAIIKAGVAVFLVLNLAGCEALARKFTRKKKADQKEEMVLAPVEYKPTMDHVALYKQYLLFWKSWQDELIAALLNNASHKKKIDCAGQAIKNLVAMRALLSPDKQAILDKYLARMNDLEDLIKGDIYGRSNLNYRQKADVLKMDILRNFSFSHVEKSII